MSPATLGAWMWAIRLVDAAAVVAAALYWLWPRASRETRWRRLTVALAGLTVWLGLSVVGLRTLGRREQALSHYYAGLDQVKRGDLGAAERELRESLKWDSRSREAQEQLRRVTEQPRAARREQRIELRPGAPGEKPARASPPLSHREPPPPRFDHPPHLPSPFVITRYALEVRLDPPRHTLVATARVTVRSRKERLRRLTFSLSPDFDVQAVSQAGARLRFDHRSDLLETDLATPLDAATEQTLQVRYRTRASGVARGLPGLLHGGDVIAPEGTYLRAESRWYPATGELDFRAPVSVAVTVPRGYTAVSAGRRQGIEKAAGSTTFRWATERPAAMVSLAAGRYVERTVKGDGMPISTFLFARDAGRAPAFLREAARIVRFYRSRFGAYPFEKLAVVEIPHFPGGYGTTSFVMLTEASFRPKKVPVDFLAHEIAHQWWGNSVFPQGPGAGWLSEAFAEYASYMYLESVGGPKALQRAVRQAAAQYLDTVRSKPEEPIAQTDPYDQRGAYQAVIYNKGALVLHALRYTMGDGAFFRLLRRFADSHRYGSVRIEEFRAAAEATHGQPLGWFFDQWLGRTGAPKLTYHYREEAGKARVVVTQPEPAYRLAIDLAIESRNHVAHHRVMVDGTRQELTVPAGGPISSLGFDPEDWILKEPVRWESAAAPGEK